MSLKQDLHLAYVLHTRAYRETSLLVEMLSCEHGRVSLVARGAKRGKAKSSGILQPFTPLQVGWHGTGDLVTLTVVETANPSQTLQGGDAICGLYMNELLIKLVHKWDNCGHLFNAYEAALLGLADNAIANQVVLRKFEMQLLKSLGYALQLSKEVDTGLAIAAESYYMFDPVLGPRLTKTAHVAAIKGISLLSLANEIWDTTPAVLLDIKRLMRMVLRHHLGNKQLMSRELL